MEMLQERIGRSQASAAEGVITDRVTLAGKFFRRGPEKWYVKGFSYGPFAPNSDGESLPEREQMLADFAHMRELGANSLRVYYPPPVWLLDDALDHDLRVFIDVPWEKHRCFFEDWDAQQRALKSVRETAKMAGNHPGVFAISVGNEIPADIVRFYGQQRIARFIDKLIDAAKQEAPDCLTTYVNFPTTEFLTPSACDFYCFNVYIHDERKLGSYLDRLQHVAGDRPLILGEYGIDTIREGDVEQADMLTKHLRRVFGHGLAGSYIFAYTDDWFTGGHQIEDWAFGVTRTDRVEKVSAKVLQRVWSELPHGRLRNEKHRNFESLPLGDDPGSLPVGDDPGSLPLPLGEGRGEGDRATEAKAPPIASALPKVSVVVCSYNGSTTLRECLDSVRQLNYPNYEVILVDDGSADATATIASEFPELIYHHQENQGLSVARNVGAELATGEIVAYTDDDCVVDEDWLRYLVQSMQDQGVEAIGGPNITPASDGWVAKCVAASPGNPSHVMIDDQHAEHVPGCNMAFRRGTLLALGGFDHQFRQAGDDVDVCWRLQDAGYRIGYAAGAMVWHHRRATVAAYAKQQKGYGRSEAIVHFKHPQRFGPYGRSSWQGIIYGDGAVGLPLKRELVYHGRFGSGLFQTIYRHNDYGAWSCLLSLEWHLVAIFILLLATLFWPLAGISGLMWLATLTLGLRMGSQAPLPKGAPWWCRPLVAYLYILQPILRGWYRHTHSLRQMKLPTAARRRTATDGQIKPISATRQDLYWQSDENIGRDELLTQLVDEARRAGFRGDFDNAWADWDIRLIGDRWHDITIRTATEELGWPKRFTRARCTVRNTRFSSVVVTTIAVWAVAAMISLQPWAIGVGLLACLSTFLCIRLSRRRCLSAVTGLVAQAGQRCGLSPVLVDAASNPEAENSEIQPFSASPSVALQHANEDSGII